MTKYLVFRLGLKLFISLVLWNFINCDCPFPKDEIINGEYIYTRAVDVKRSNAKEHYILLFRCFVGYELIGAHVIQCFDGKWSGKVPSCEAMQCDAPPKIINGAYAFTARDKTEITIGTEAIYSCKPGYKLSEPSASRLTCILNEDRDGTLWAGDIPACQEIICNRPEPLVNGNIPELEKSNFNDTFPNNFVLTYDCNEGYRLKGGEPWRFCGKDGWSGTNPYCEEIFCPDPGAPEQGSRQGDSFKVGAKVRFECLTGYQLLGSVERYCSPNGKWTGEVARCNAKTNYCPNPGIPINGIRNGESYDEGDTIEFRCRSGFIHVGSKERTCMSDRSWNGTETICLEPHDFDSTQEIGRNLKKRLEEKFDEEIKEYKMLLSARGMTGEDGGALKIPSSGRLIIYFAFDASGSIEKKNFKKGIEFAKAIVKKIGISENGARAGALVFSTEPENIFYPMDHQNTQDVLDHLDAIEYTGGGSSVTSALRMVIENIRLEEGQENFDNNNRKTVLFLITDGKGNTGGSPEREAENLKKYLNVEIFCIGITGDVRTDALYKIASTSKNGNKERSNVFILKNYEKLNWLIQDLTNGTIEIICNRPEPLANGNIRELEKSNFNDTFPNNFVLTYDCNEGYRLKGGEPWRFCGKDGWSGTDPYCEEISCPDPGAPEQGSREGDSFKVGAKVGFKCFSGYQLLGSVERFCSSNGRWTGELTRCNAPTNYCPNPGIPINGIRNGESYDEGDTIEFRCRSGFIHVGSKERTCMSDRTWNGTETICLDPHDFDSTQEIGRNLKKILDEKFDEEIKEYKMLLSARGITEEDGGALKIPSNGRFTIYFAFDVSGSIEKINFKKGIEFAKAIVKKIGISENGARAGALVFSTEPENIFYPMDYRNTQDVLDHLDAIEYTGGGTSVTSALRMVIENIRLEEGQVDFDNNNRKTVLFLITDGKGNTGGSPEREAENLKKYLNVEIFCIGITGDVRTDALYKIASTSKNGNNERSNVFILKNYEKLNWLIQDLTNGTIDYSTCGLGMESKMNINGGRILDGEISVEPWPWMATLFFRDNKEKGAKFEFKCGGSIINENFILTGATCLFIRDMKTLEYRKRTEEEIIVKLGLVDRRNESFVQEFYVQAIFIHENYTQGSGSYDNDIALLKLDRPITYAPFVRPVCLPPPVLPEDNNNPFYKAGEYGWVIGFGTEKQIKPHQRHVQFKLSKHLKELLLPIQPKEKCSSSLGTRNKHLFTERMFCAGDGMSGNDTCKGDSGGPFMQSQMNSQGDVYWTQVGIVSWGIGCGTKDNYGYYTRVQRFRPWIDEKLKEVVPEESGSGVLWN